MATCIRNSKNYQAFTMRGAAALVRRIWDGEEGFFQAGDDANSFLAAVEAIDEIEGEEKQNDVFDILCSQYFN